MVKRPKGANAKHANGIGARDQKDRKGMEEAAAKRLKSRKNGTEGTDGINEIRDELPSRATLRLA